MHAEEPERTDETHTRKGRNAEEEEVGTEPADCPHANGSTLHPSTDRPDRCLDG